MHLLPTVKESDLSVLAAVYMGDAFRDRGLFIFLFCRQIAIPGPSDMLVCRLPRRLPEPRNGYRSSHPHIFTIASD